MSDLFSGLILVFVCCVFWWEIKQGIVLRCLDLCDWILAKLKWVIDRRAELKAKLEALEKNQENPKD